MGSIHFLYLTVLIQDDHMGSETIGHMALWIGHIRAQLVGGVKEFSKELPALQL